MAVVLLFVLTLAGIVWAIWSSIEQRRQAQRKLKALQLSDVDVMSGIEFEHYVAKLLQFRGFQVSVTKGSGDFGVDIVANKDGMKYAIQVKRYNSGISRRAVSDAVAGKHMYKCDTPMVVTNSFFTIGAKQLAQSTGCLLIDRTQLAEWILAFQQNDSNAHEIHKKNISIASAESLGALVILISVFYFLGALIKANKPDMSQREATNVAANTASAPMPSTTGTNVSTSEQKKPTEEVPRAQPAAAFVVFPGQYVGNFFLGRTKEEVLKSVPKPQENTLNRLVYQSKKTGNVLRAHFQKNRLVQIDFTSKDFYTWEGIHTRNFRDEQYAHLFDVQEMPATSLRLKYTLKTGGLTFYGNADALSRAVGIVHTGQSPLYAVQDMVGTANAQVSEAPQQPVNELASEKIALMKKGGVYEIPVEINRVITLNFVLDTGATDVNIPADVALTLYRAGTIRDTDFLTGRTYSLADGSTVRSKRFLLRSLKIGSKHIANVPASIGEVASPLLLGQSFLEKLGSWGFDSQKQILTIGAGVQREASTPLLSTPPATSSTFPPSQSVGLPNTKIGDTYSIEYFDPDNLKARYSLERKVIAVNEGAITVTSKNVKSKIGKARILQFTSEWNLVSSRNPDGSGFDYSPPLKYFAFPLYSGKTWQQTSRETHSQTGAVREHTLSATVGNWEEVTVPAGTFRALKITIQTELLDRTTAQKSTGTDISWYAPTIRRSVRSEIISRDFQEQQERQVIQMIQHDIK